MTKQDIIDISKALLSRCDGAHAQDGMGYNGADTGYIHWIAETFYCGNEDGMPAKSVEKVRKILLKYKHQIESLEYDYSLITTPYTQEKTASNERYVILVTTKDSSVISFKTKYDNAFKNDIKSKGGRWNPARYTWDLKFRSIKEIEIIESLIQKYGFAYKNNETMQALKTAYAKFKIDKDEKEKLIKMSSKADAAGIAGIDTPDGITLYPYQQVGVDWIEKTGNSLIADEMGLGKTPESLIYCYNHPEKAPYLVVVPNCVKINWMREIKKFCNSESVTIINGRKPYNLPKTDYYVINYDVISYWVEDLKKLNFKILIMDEVHFIKTPTSKRTKACMALTKHESVQNVIALTGTPILNRPVELLPVLRALKVEHPDLINDMRFKKKYCLKGYNRYGGDYSGANNLDELQTMLRSTCMIRRLKKFVLKEMPEKRRSIIPIDISNRATYMKAENNFVKWYKDVKNRSVNSQAEALVKIEALKQLTYQGKMKALFEYIDNLLESNDKIVISAHHRALQNAIYDHYSAKVKTVKIIGGMKMDDRVKAEDEFQKGDARIVVASLKGANVGINLHAANVMVITELGWTPADMSQMEDRIHRNGQKNICDIYYVVGSNTIEDYIATILHNKQDIIDKSLDGSGDVNSGNIFDELMNSLTN